MVIVVVVVVAYGSFIVLVHGVAEVVLTCMLIVVQPLLHRRWHVIMCTLLVVRVDYPKR